MYSSRWYRPHVDTARIFSPISKAKRTIAGGLRSAINPFFHAQILDGVMAISPNAHPQKDCLVALLLPYACPSAHDSVIQKQTRRKNPTAGIEAQTPPAAASPSAMLTLLSQAGLRACEQSSKNFGGSPSRAAAQWLCDPPQLAYRCGGSIGIVPRHREQRTDFPFHPSGGYR